MKGGAADALDGHQRPASRPDQSASDGIFRGTPWILGLVGPRASLRVFRKGRKKSVM